MMRVICGVCPHVFSSFLVLRLCFFASAFFCLSLWVFRLSFYLSFLVCFGFALSLWQISLPLSFQFPRSSFLLYGHAFEEDMRVPLIFFLQGARVPVTLRIETKILLSFLHCSEWFCLRVYDKIIRSFRRCQFRFLFRSTRPLWAHQQQGRWGLRRSGHI